VRSEPSVINRELDRLFRLGTADSMTDPQLLEVFLGENDQSAALAFEAIVDRHGPMVLRTCRTVLRDLHAAEDAFQATFLILARKAQAIGSRELLGSWLHGVAVRTARKARSLAARQRLRERESAPLRAGAVDGSRHDGLDDDLCRILHEEIDRLPQSYRSAIAACYLEGKSHSEAAAQLCLSESTIRGRLARARRLLDRRLTRRDASPAGAFIALAASQLCGDGLPRGTAQSTARAALMFLNRCQAAHGAVSLRARALANGELFAMWTYRLKTALAVIIALGTLATGGALLTLPTARAQPQQNSDTIPQEGLSADQGTSAIAYAAPTYPNRLAQEFKDGATQGESAKVDPDLAKLATGSIVRTIPVSKDSMILSYLPDWNHGEVDNIGFGNNDGGNRMLIDWSTGIRADEANLPDHRFLIAVYSRETISNPPAGPIHAFEITEDWPERVSWTSRPSYDPEPVATYRFEPGTGWKLFDITPLLQAQAKAGRKSHGVLFRFVSEDLSGAKHSDYKCVSREGTGEWEARRPVLMVVKGSKNDRAVERN
jgi:RNA polymerase sigma factor (sigma-70 family)